MGSRGPKPVSAEELFFFAHQFYQDFRLLAYGSSRWIFDAQKYKELVTELGKKPLQLSSADRARLPRLQRVAARKIARGRLKESEKEEWLRAAANPSTRWFAAMDAQKQIRIPGEPAVVEALLRAKTPKQVRDICKDAFTLTTIEVKPGIQQEVEVPNWPLVQGSMFPHYLSQYAEEFLAAKRDPRFPRSSRPSTQQKRLWFLSRALAGALFGLRPRTAINLVGSKTPEEIFEETFGARAVRKSTKQRSRQ